MLKLKFSRTGIPQAVFANDIPIIGVSFLNFLESTVRRMNNNWIDFIMLSDETLRRWRKFVKR